MSAPTAEQVPANDAAADGEVISPAADQSEFVAYFRNYDEHVMGLLAAEAPETPDEARLVIRNVAGMLASDIEDFADQMVGLPGPPPFEPPPAPAGPPPAPVPGAPS